MKDKILKALKEITNEVVSMNDEDFQKIIDKNKNGKYAKVLKDICFTTNFEYESKFHVDETLYFDINKKYSTEELMKYMQFYVEKLEWVTAMYNIKKDDSFPLAA